MVVAATLAGQGLAWIPDDAVAGHIGAGRLVSVLDDWAQTVSEYHAYRANCSSSPAVGLVLDPLRQADEW
jgi:DNA-binding transcriptional LysR family regulator